MSKKDHEINQTNLLMAGFALFMSGSLMTSAFEGNRIVQVIGVVIIIASSAFFGVVIGLRLKQKK